VTVHNSAANIYAYGSNTTVYVDHAWLYSGGPSPMASMPLAMPPLMSLMHTHSHVASDPRHFLVTVLPDICTSATLTLILLALEVQISMHWVVYMSTTSPQSPKTHRLFYGWEADRGTHQLRDNGGITGLGGYIQLFDARIQRSTQDH
jgi:hypothetical protein